jgi:hypothetical protein
MCMKKADLYAKAKWDGATGSSRQELLDDLQGERSSDHAVNEPCLKPSCL